MVSGLKYGFIIGIVLTWLVSNVLLLEASLWSLVFFLMFISVLIGKIVGWNSSHSSNSSLGKHGTKTLISVRGAGRIFIPVERKAPKRVCASLLMSQRTYWSGPRSMVFENNKNAIYINCFQFFNRNQMIWKYYGLIKTRVQFGYCEKSAPQF